MVVGKHAQVQIQEERERGQVQEQVIGPAETHSLIDLTPSQLKVAEEELGEHKKALKCLKCAGILRAKLENPHSDNRPVECLWCQK